LARVWRLLLAAEALRLVLRRGAGICVWYLRLVLAMRDAETTVRTGQQSVWVRSYFMRWGLLVAAAFVCGFVGGAQAALACLITVLAANWLFAVASVYQERRENA